MQDQSITRLDSAIMNDDYLFSQYNLVSTALTNFLPQLPVSLHPGIYEDILFHKHSANTDQFDETALDHLVLEGHQKDALEILRSQPSIICTYHTGSFRLLNHYLAHLNIPLAIVLSGTVLKSEKESLIHQASSITAKNDNIGVRFIVAEETNSLLQMIRAVKEGRSLVLYIDGNTGAGMDTSINDNSCIIRFLHSSLHARKGIAYLASRLKVPLISIANYRNTANASCMRFFKPCFVGNSTSEIVSTTQQLYDNISPIVRDFPGQWEAWLYIHKVAVPSQGKTITRFNTSKYNTYDQYIFNHRSFSIINHLGNCFLINKIQYVFYAIDKQLYQFLKDSFSRPVKARNLPAAIYADLLNEKVIIPMSSS